MAKPKGGMLARLFEVREAERQALFERIQQRTLALDTVTVPNAASVSHTDSVSRDDTAPPANIRTNEKPENAEVTYG
jgi:hypothetical protein